MDNVQTESKLSVDWMKTKEHWQPQQELLPWSTNITTFETDVHQSIIIQILPRLIPSVTDYQYTAHSLHKVCHFMLDVRTATGLLQQDLGLKVFLRTSLRIWYDLR